MGSPIVPTYSTEAKGWTKHLATSVTQPPAVQSITRRCSAGTSFTVQSVPRSSSQPVTRSASVDYSPAAGQSLPAFMTVILDFQSLRIKVRDSASSDSVFFTEWPGSPGEALPAVIAYDVERIVWGIEAVAHPNRIENLGQLMESKSAKGQLIGQRKSSSQVLGDFFDCVFGHVSTIKSLKKELCQYTFVIPTHWDDRQMGRYAKAINFAVNEPDSISFIKTIEAAAVGLIRNLRLGSQRKGVVLIESEGSSIY